MARPVAWIRRPSAAFCSRPPRVLRPLGQRARLAGVEHQHGLLGEDAREPSLQPVLADGVAHERLLGVVAQVVGDEVVAAVEGLAVAGGEEHEHIARAHLGGKVREDLVELGGGGVAVEDMGDDHVLVVALAGVLERGSKASWRPGPRR